MGHADTSDSPPDYVLIHEWCLRKRHEKRPIHCFKIQDEKTEFRTMVCGCGSTVPGSLTIHKVPD